jgi:NTP pyrophosphatase (non-canonical NTP hydrolase)
MTNYQHMKFFMAYFGEEAQVKKLKEEVEELAVELKSNPPDVSSIADELADVLNVLEQFIVHYDIRDAVEKRREFKLERTLTRIKGGYYEANNQETPDDASRKRLQETLRENKIRELFDSMTEDGPLLREDAIQLVRELGEMGILK